MKISQINNEHNKLTQSYVYIKDKAERRKMKNKEMETLLKKADSKQIELTEMVKSLTKKAEMLETSLSLKTSQYNHEINELSNQLFEKNIELSDCRSLITKYETKSIHSEEIGNKLEKTEKQCQSLVVELKKSKDIITQNKIDHSKSLREFSEKQKEYVKQLDEELQSSRSDYQNLKEQYRQLEEDYETTKAQLAENQTILEETIMTSSTTHQNQIHAMNSRLEKSQKLCKQLATQLGGSPTKQQLQVLTERIRDLESENNQLRSTIVSRKDEIETHKTHVLEKENSNLKAEIKIYESKFTEMISALDNLKNINSKHQKNELRMTQLLTQAMNQIEKKQLSIKEAKKELRQENERSQQLLLTISELENKKKKFEAQLDIYRKQISQITPRLENIEAQQEILKDHF